jgi:SAM-dependent methyltransferase
MGAHESELERIREAYRARAAAPAAGGYSWHSSGYRFYMQQLERELLEALGRVQAPLVGGRVLEVGCGSGYFLHRLIEYGAAHGAGVDLMPGRIEQAQARYPNLELVAGDASALPWEDASFDVVSQFTCLSSVLDAALRARIAGEMWRVLRPGGVIVSYDMRRTPGAVRLLGRVRLRPATAAAPVAASTPTTPIEVAELLRLFPEGALRHKAVSLNLDLAGMATRVPGLATVAAALRPLRSHLLVTVSRPR